MDGSAQLPWLCIVLLFGVCETDGCTTPNSDSTSMTADSTTASLTLGPETTFTASSSVSTTPSTLETSPLDSTTNSNLSQSDTSSTISSLSQSDTSSTISSPSQSDTSSTISSPSQFGTSSTISSSSQSTPSPTTSSSSQSTTSPTTSQSSQSNASLTTSSTFWSIFKNFSPINIYFIVTVIVVGVVLIAAIVAVLAVRSKCRKKKAKKSDRENCGWSPKDARAPEDQDNRFSSHSCDVYVDLDDVSTAPLPGYAALCQGKTQKGVKGPKGRDVIVFDNLAYMSGHDVISTRDVTHVYDNTDEILMVDNDIYGSSALVGTVKRLNNRGTTGADNNQDEVMMIDNLVYASFSPQSLKTCRK